MRRKQSKENVNLWGVCFQFFIILFISFQEVKIEWLYISEAESIFYEVINFSLLEPSKIFQKLIKKYQKVKQTLLQRSAGFAGFVSPSNLQRSAGFVSPSTRCCSIKPTIQQTPSSVLVLVRQPTRLPHTTAALLSSPPLPSRRSSLTRWPPPHLPCRRRCGPRSMTPTAEAPPGSR
jgi:hypothetical protein